MSKHQKKLTLQQQKAPEIQWYITAVTDTHLWFDKATELLLFAKLIEERLRQAWIHARDYNPQKMPLNVEEIAKHIEEEKKLEKWPLQSQGLYLAMVSFAVENLCKADIIRANKQEITEETNKKNTRFSIPNC